MRRYEEESYYYIFCSQKLVINPLRETFRVSLSLQKPTQLLSFLSQDRLVFKFLISEERCFCLKFFFFFVMKDLKNSDSVQSRQGRLPVDVHTLEVTVLDASQRLCNVGNASSHKQFGPRLYHQDG